MEPVREQIDLHITIHNEVFKSFSPLVRKGDAVQSTFLYNLISKINNQIGEQLDRDSLNQN